MTRNDDFSDAPFYDSYVANKSSTFRQACRAIKATYGQKHSERNRKVTRFFLLSCLSCLRQNASILSFIAVACQ